MMIGKISELLLSGGSRGGFMEAATSPRSPLEMNVQSPRGMKSYDVSGGIGLGIVAALGKSSNNNNNGCEVLEKYAIYYSRSSSSASSSARSNPIPVGDVGLKKFEQSCCDDELDMDSLEDYTFVTCRQHGPNKQSFTKVYYAKGEIFGKGTETRSKKSSIFSISPGRCGEGFSEVPREDFLSSCNLCKKKLHGKDVYMYRGEMAFCSEECRIKQIIIDEGKELWRSEASRSSDDVSSSTCTRDYMFSPSILAI